MSDQVDVPQCVGRRNKKRRQEDTTEMIRYHPAVILWTDKDRQWEALLPSVTRTPPYIDVRTNTGQQRGQGQQIGYVALSLVLSQTTNFQLEGSASHLPARD